MSYIEDKNNVHGHGTAALRKESIEVESQHDYTQKMISDCVRSVRLGVMVTVRDRI
jgi:hypothetical protein